MFFTLRVRSRLFLSATRFSRRKIRISFVTANGTKRFPFHAPGRQSDQTQRQSKRLKRILVLLKFAGNCPVLLPSLPRARIYTHTHTHTPFHWNKHCRGSNIYIILKRAETRDGNPQNVFAVIGCARRRRRRLIDYIKTRNYIRE